jgi:hypothetical protein
MWARCLIAVALAGLLPGGRFDVRKVKEPPRWLAPQSYREPVAEPPYAWQFLLLLGLTALTRSAESWTWVFGAAPLLAYRLGSRLWTECDLESGQISHHRTFCGLQISRPGVHLAEACQVISGRPLARIGEQPTYAVALRIQNGSLVNIQSSGDVASSHQAGRRLAHKLDLPHYPIEAGQRQPPARAEDPWDDLPAPPQPEKRGCLPP